MSLNIVSLNGDTKDVNFAIALEKRGLLGKKWAPRWLQRYQKRLRKAGYSWADIDRAVWARASLKWLYRLEDIRELTYTSSPFLALVPRG